MDFTDTVEHKTDQFFDAEGTQVFRKENVFPSFADWSYLASEVNMCRWRELVDVGAVTGNMASVEHRQDCKMMLAL